MPKCKLKEIKSTLIQMCDMQPLQIGYIKDASHCDDGNIVMRTASTDNLEVINLTKFRKNYCYTNTNNKTSIKLFAKPVTLIIEN